MTDTLFNKRYYEDNIELIQTFNNEIFIARYGSVENAEIALKNIKEKSKTNEEFIKQVQFELFISEINQITNLLMKLTSFSEMILCYSNLKINVQKIITNSNRKDELVNFLPKYFSIGNEYIVKNDIKRNSKNKYSVKEVREELIFKNKKTFTKWLNHFYGDKYNNTRYFTVDEYADVFKKFFLKVSEDKLEIQKFNDEYLIRLKEKLRYKKSDLTYLAKNDYKILKEDIKDIDQLLSLGLPKNVDSFPFSIAHQIIINLV